MSKITKLLKEKASGALVVVRFDDKGAVDTIERNGKPINSTPPTARKVLNNADAILHGDITRTPFLWSNGGAL